MEIHDLYQKAGASFRQKRMLAFVLEMKPTTSTCILDVGGTKDFWDESNVMGSITLLNRGFRRTCAHTGRIYYVCGDARQLPFKDNFLRETRLLSATEMADMFPECRVVHERFLGMTKSLIAVK